MKWNGSQGTEQFQNMYFENLNGSNSFKNQSIWEISIDLSPGTYWDSFYPYNIFGGLKLLIGKHFKNASNSSSSLEYILRLLRLPLHLGFKKALKFPKLLQMAYHVSFGYTLYFIKGTKSAIKISTST